MTTEQRVQDLVQRWRGENRPVDLETLCADCPELLDVVRRRIAELPSDHVPLGSTVLAGPDNQAADTVPLQPWLQPGAEPVAGYHLIRKLGQGGFGEVWEATGPGGIQVAIKFVPLADQHGNVELSAFQIIKNIRHPNLLAIFGAWQVRGCLAVAMELADGTLLDRYDDAVKQGQPGIPRRELLRYSRDAATVLDYLNKPRHFLGGKKPVGIQHCDIKPQNLLLLGGGVKVADFGLARVLEGSAGFHGGGLTPAYAAPELFDGRMTRHSDQYALAVTYCQLRSGKLPFTGNLSQLKDGHLSAAPNLSMLPAVERPIIERALAKSPHARWPNCRAFVKALVDCARTPKETSIAGDSPVVLMSGSKSATEAGQVTTDFFEETKDASPSSFTWKTTKDVRSLSKRHPWLLAGLLAGGLLIGGVTALTWWYSQEVMRKSDPDLSAISHVTAKIAEDLPGTAPQKVAEPGKLPQERVSEPQARIDLYGPSRGGESKIPPVDLKMMPPLAAGHAKSAAPEPLPPPTEPMVELVQDNLPAPAPPFAARQPAEVHPFQTATESLPAKPETSSRRVETFPTWLHWMLLGIWSLLLIVLACRWRPRTRVLPPEGLRLTGHEDGIWSVACSPDGKHVVTGSLDHTLRLWDRASGREVKCFTGHTEGVTCVAFSQNGRRLLSGSLDNTLRLWDIATGQTLVQLKGHEEGVTCTAISLDGSQILSGSFDRTLRLWDAATGRELAILAHAAEVIWSVAFASDGRHALSAGGGRSAEEPTRGSDFDVKLWDLAERRELHRFVGHTAAVRGITFTPDGGTAISGGVDRSVRIWDVATGRQLRSMDGHTDWVRAVAVSPDGKFIASGSDDESARLWRLSDGAEVGVLHGHDWSVTSVAFLPDGREIVTGSDDMTALIRLFEPGA